jgi:DNA-directed RNA polymerase subunit RPC12/RpoP
MTTKVEPATSLRCPVCKAKVVVALPNEVVIHNAILKVDAGTDRVSAKCARCKAWVQVPLRYTGERATS